MSLDLGLSTTLLGRLAYSMLECDRGEEPCRDAVAVDEGASIFSRVGHAILVPIRWMSPGAFVGLIHSLGSTKMMSKTCDRDPYDSAVDAPIRDSIAQLVLNRDFYTLCPPMPIDSVD
ncbi:MAG: hypothetical protein ACI97A_003289 [Planctomycetota bacterium]|jgi:hypothetical protein